MGGNVNVGLSVTVNVHAVHYCMLTQSDTVLVTEILNLEFTQLIHAFFFFTACASKTKLCSKVHVSGTYKGSLISKV